MATTNDWLVVNIKAPGVTAVDLEVNDITPENTVLKDKNYYKDSPVVKDMFTDTNTGKFDDTAFSNYYNGLLYAYNEFATGKMEKDALDSYEYELGSVLAPDNAKYNVNPVTVKKVYNPFDLNVGHRGLGLISDSPYSIVELAQRREVKDHVTGESLGWTPNDDDRRGLFDFWKNPTIAMAQWDEDGMHYDAELGRQVQHKRGDYKTDAEGFYFETLGDRSAANRRIASWTDTLTVDADYASNRFDFLDSDGLDKSITGIVAKTAFKAAPLFIPVVGEIYAAGLIAAELANVAPMIIQSGAAMFVGDADVNKDYWKHLNQLQGFSKTLSASTMSDYGKSNMFSMESFGGMVGDIFSQLYTQRFIANIPNLLGRSTTQAKAASAAYQYLGKEAGDRMLQGSLTATEKFQILEKFPEAAGFINRKISNLETSRMLSTLYMSVTSAASVAEESKALGLDERDTGAMFLGTTAGFFGMMRYLPIGEWAIRGVGLDDQGAMVKKAVKEFAQQLPGDKLAGTSAKTAVKNAAHYQKMYEKGLELFGSIKDKLSTKVTDFSGAMWSEGAEEMTEEFMQDGIKNVYNGLSSLGLVSTDKGNQFSFGSAKDILARYGMAGLGGAVGGALFHANDLFRNGPGTTDKDTKKQIEWLVRNGHTDQILKQIDELEKKGGFGSTALSLETTDTFLPGLGSTMLFKPAEDPTKSQNAAIAKVARNYITNINNQIFQEGIPNDITLSALLDARTDLIVDLKVNSPLFDDLNRIATDILSIKEQIDQASTVTLDAAPGSVESAKKKVGDLNVELSMKRDELKAITSGEKFVEYQEYALFGISPRLNQAFARASLNDYALGQKGVNFEDLNEQEKTALKVKYEAWKQLEAKMKFKEGFKIFKAMNTKFSPFLEKLGMYAGQRKGFYNMIDINQTFVNADGSSRPATYNTRGDLQITKALRDETLDVIAKTKEFFNANIYNKKHRFMHLSNIVADAKAQEESNDIQLKVRAGKINAKNEIMALISRRSGKIDLSAVQDMRRVLESFTLFDLLGSQYIDAAYDEAPTQDVILDEETGEPMLDEAGNPVMQVYYPDPVLFSFSMNEDSANLDTAQIVEQVAEARVLDIEDIYKEYVELIKQKASKENVDADLATLDRLFGRLRALTTEAHATLQEFDAKTAGKTINTLNELLHQYAIIIDKNPSTVLELLAGEYDSIKKIEDIKDYELTKPTLAESLVQAKVLVHQLESLMHAATDFNYGSNGFNGYNNVINKTFPANPKLGVISQEEYATLVKELKIVEEKIDFLLKLSMMNSENKIKNQEQGGINMEMLFYEQLTPGTALHDYLKTISIGGEDFMDESITTAVAKAKLLRKALDSKRQDKVNYFPTSEEELIQFEQERHAVHKALYNRVQYFISKSTAVDKESEVFNHIFGINSTNARTGKSVLLFPELELSNPNRLTEYSSTETTIEPEALFTWLNTKFSVDPDAFVASIRGEKNVDGTYTGMESSEYAPFYSQEYAAQVVFGLITNPKWFNKATGQLSSGDNAFLSGVIKPFLNAVFVDGLPGSGKTTAVANMIAKMLKDRGINFWVAAPHLEQAAQLQASLIGGDTIDETRTFNKGKLFEKLMGGSTKLLTSIQTALNVKVEADTEFLGEDKIIVKKKVEQVINGKNSQFEYFELNEDHALIKEFIKSGTINTAIPEVIFIDEITHFSSVELRLLQLIMEKMPNPPKLIFLGDTRQNGASIGESTHNIDRFQIIKTPKLSVSLRSTNHIKRKNIQSIVNAYMLVDQTYKDMSRGGNMGYAQVKELIKSKLAINDAKFGGITLGYYEGENGKVYGEQVISPNDLTIDKLKALAATTTGHIGFVTDNANSPLVQEINKDINLKDKIKIHTVSNIQGREYDTVVVDINWKNYVDTEGDLSYQSLMSNLYTLLSRSKSGTVILDREFSALSNLIPIKTFKEEDVFLTELDPVLVKAYKEKRINILNKLTEGINYKISKQPGSGTLSGTADVEELSFLKILYKALSDKERNPANDGDVIRTYESRPIPENTSKLLTYSYKDYIGVKLNNKGEIASKSMEDLGFVDTITSGLIDKNEVSSATEGLRKFRAAFLYNPDPSILANYFQISADSGVNLANAKLVVRATIFDKSKKLTEDNVLLRVMLEVPRQINGLDAEPGYITISDFAQLSTVKKNAGENSVLYQRLKDIIDEARPHLETEEEFDFELEENALTPATNAVLIKNNPVMSYEDMVKNSDALISPPMIITGHNPVGSTEGDADFRQWAKEHKLIGRAICFGTYDPSFTDPRELFSAFIQERNEYERLSKTNPVAAMEFIPKVKMLILDPKPVSFKEWIALIKKRIDKNTLPQIPIKTVASPHMAARVYNAIARVYMLNKDNHTLALELEEILCRVFTMFENEYPAGKGIKTKTEKAEWVVNLLGASDTSKYKERLHESQLDKIANDILGNHKKGTSILDNSEYDLSYRLLVALSIAINGGVHKGKKTDGTEYTMNFTAIKDLISTERMDALGNFIEEQLKVEFPNGIYTHPIYMRKGQSGKIENSITDYVELAEGDFVSDARFQIFQNHLDLFKIKTVTPIKRVGPSPEEIARTRDIANAEVELKAIYEEANKFLLEEAGITVNTLIKTTHESWLKALESGQPVNTVKQITIDKFKGDVNSLYKNPEVVKRAITKQISVKIGKSLEPIELSFVNVSTNGKIVNFEVNYGDHTYIGSLDTTLRGSRILTDFTARMNTKDLNLVENTRALIIDSITKLIIEPKVVSNLALTGALKSIQAEILNTTPEALDAALSDSSSVASKNINLIIENDLEELANSIAEFSQLPC